MRELPAFPTPSLEDTVNFGTLIPTASLTHPWFNVTNCLIDGAPRNGEGVVNYLTVLLNTNA